MLTIHGSTISMIRGDTAAINLNISINGNQYNYSAGDKLTFSMKSHADDQECALQIKMNSTRLVINHADTNSLDAKTYVYDIQLELSSGQVITYGPGALILLADVTRN